MTRPRRGRDTLLALDPAIPLGLNLGVDLFVQVRHRAPLTRVPQSAS